MIEAHVHATADLLRGDFLLERHVELEDRLEGAQAVALGRVDGEPTSALAAERAARKAVGRGGDLPANLTRQYLADPAAQTELDALGAIAQ